MRKKQAAQAFSKFFVAKKKADVSMVDDDTSKDSAESGESLVAIKSSFMPFQIRERMKVAPCVRLNIDKQQLKVLDESLKCVKPLKELYIEQLKSGLHKPGSSPKTWQSEDKDDDDIIAIGLLLIIEFLLHKLIPKIFQMSLTVLEKTFKQTKARSK